MKNTSLVEVQWGYLRTLQHKAWLLDWMEENIRELRVDGVGSARRIAGTTQHGAWGGFTSISEAVERLMEEEE